LGLAVATPVAFEFVAFTAVAPAAVAFGRDVVDASIFVALSCAALSSSSEFGVVSLGAPSAIDVLTFAE
jgi:hypothetical protein